MNKETESIIHILDEENRFVPKASIVDEFEIILERLKFSLLEKKISKKKDISDAKSKLEIIFKEIISPQMYIVLTKLLEEDKIKVLFGEQSKVILEEVRSYYEGINEISVTTAVDLTDEFKNWLGSGVLSKDDMAARVIFQTDETICAGMIISGKHFRRDLSYRKNILPLIRNHLLQKLSQTKI